MKIAICEGCEKRKHLVNESQCPDCQPPTIQLYTIGPSKVIYEAMLTVQANDPDLPPSHKDEYGTLFAEILDLNPNRKGVDVLGGAFDDIRSAMDDYAANSRANTAVVAEAVEEMDEVEPTTVELNRLSDATERCS